MARQARRRTEADTLSYESRLLLEHMYQQGEASARGLPAANPRKPARTLPPREPPRADPLHALLRMHPGRTLHHLLASGELQVRRLPFPPCPVRTFPLPAPREPSHCTLHNRSPLARSALWVTN